MESRQPTESSAELEQLNLKLREMERRLETRVSELAAADRHIAQLEEKLLKLREAKRDLKRVKQESHRYRKSPERKIGQVLLAPYRLPERLFKMMWQRIRPPSAPRQFPSSPYEEWLQGHRATPAELEAMRKEARTFTAQPLISIITPVFDTPVPWLTEAIESVITQAYENWELLLIDDGSTAPDFLRALPDLAARDRRIELVRLERHEGISAASNRGLARAKGEWISLLDHDDILEPDALFQVAKLLQQQPDADLIYSDEDKLTEQEFDAPLLKPDWSPDFFLSYNYIGHFTSLRRALVEELGGFRSEFDSAQDYDLFLRVVRRTPRIHHIPRVLYHWRRSANSVADTIRSKPTVLEAARHGIEDYLKRGGEHGHVAIDWRTHAFWVRRSLQEAKKISIVVAAEETDGDAVSRCLESVSNKTKYPNYELVVVSASAKPLVTDCEHRLIHWDGAFNLSGLNNFAVAQTSSPWLLFLDKNIEVIESDWLNIMAEHVQRPEVGAVGARLLNPDDTVRHAGFVLGAKELTADAFHGLPAEAPGVNRQLQVTRNCSAVSGACLLTRREVFEQVGGFDNQLSDDFSDVDLCLKMRQAGYLIVYTPFAKLYDHCAGKRRHGEAFDGSELMRARWNSALTRDPYYNPNLSRERADFSLGI